MKYYAKIINEATKECEVINQIEAEKLGLKQYDLEFAHNGKWYVKGYAPNQPLDEIKQAKLAELKNTRDSLEIEPITYNGNNFDYDEKARDRINAAIIALDLAGADAQLSWTTADNTEAIVTANDLRMVIAAVAVRSNALHVAYREAKDKVNACTTAEELEAIEW